ncbi:MAG TPA: HlyD family secretion protein [Verrucomicrobiae bacterium]|jgi:membrane fusion protein (multidrug efflux system)|nr:HlyD family secretion protein [Verrucomicrobiae bacterium]
MDELQTQGATPPKTTGENAATKNGQTSIWKRRPVVIVGTIALALLFIWGFGEFAKSFSHESTDDAFLAANIVSISPKVFGEVKQVFVKDNQMVKAGDPLVEIDPRDYQTAVAQKKAASTAAAANTNVIASSFLMLGVQIKTAEATARQSAAQAAADEATAEKASSDLKRAQDLFERKIIAPQEFDNAKAAAEAATNTWQASQAKASSDLSKIDESKAEFEAGRSAYERALAQADQADVDVSLAALNLSYTHIAAPVNGLITRKAVEVGDYVQVGQRLMAVVPTNIWVVANFKETQLTKIRTNQPVEISVDSVHGRTFAGHVDSIQAGSGAAFSLLPPENAVGNYVKVVQRVPVKIVFDNPVDAGHVLGPGMSAEPSVQTGAEMPQFVIILAAIVVALGIGFFWWRAAGKPAVA